MHALCGVATLSAAVLLCLGRSPADVHASASHDVGASDAGHASRAAAPFAFGTSRPFIDWAGLSNPVLQYNGGGTFDWSIKDATMAYSESADTFVLAFSAFYPKDGPTISHVVAVSTDSEFTQFSEPLLNWNGTKEGWKGLCSPNINRAANGRWVMTLNSWGDLPGKPNSLFYAVSDDLLSWSHYAPLAPGLETSRAIDAALVWNPASADTRGSTATDGYYMLAYKENSGSLVLAQSATLDGEFQRLTPAGIFPEMDVRAGQPVCSNHENFDFVPVSSGGAAAAGMYIVSSDYGNSTAPRTTWLYRRDGANWTHWQDGHGIPVPKQGFNTVDRANAGFVADWTQYDGYFYLLYAGSTERNDFAGRGHNRLGLARSKDLVTWETP